MAWRVILRIFVVGLALSAAGPRALLAQRSTPVAIVVHPETNVDNLAFSELRRIFMGDRQFWNNGPRVTLLVRAPVAAERKLVLEKIYEMSEEEFRAYWIKKMFRADVAAGPKLVYSSEMARELVTAIPGAIGFMPANAVGQGVKVVRVNGRLPGEPGYPLQ